MSESEAGVPRFPALLASYRQSHLNLRADGTPVS